MIWYVEDDASIRDIGIYALNSAGFETGKNGYTDKPGFLNGFTEYERALLLPTTFTQNTASGAESSPSRAVTGSGSTTQSAPAAVSAADFWYNLALEK